MRQLLLLLPCFACASSTAPQKSPLGSTAPAYAFADAAKPSALVGWACAENVERAAADARRVLTELQRAYPDGVTRDPKEVSHFTTADGACVELRTFISELDQDFAAAHPDPDPKGRIRPDWIDHPETRVDPGRVLAGTGASTGVRNVSLAVAMADNRARAEVAKAYEVLSSAAVKSYMAEKSDDLASSREEQATGSILKTLAELVLGRAEIVERYRSPDGACHSLATVTLDGLIEEAEKKKTLPPEIVARFVEVLERMRTSDESR